MATPPRRAVVPVLSVTAAATASSLSSTAAGGLSPRVGVLGVGSVMVSKT